MPANTTGLSVTRPTEVEILITRNSREARDGALQTGMAEGLADGLRRLDEVLAAMTSGEAN